MPWWTIRALLARLASYARRNALDDDFDEELAAHVALAADDYQRQGMSAADARRRALMTIGGVDASKQRHREARGLPSVEGLVQDVRYALRRLLRSPGFALAAVLTLAVGIGVNTAVFTLTSGLFKGFALVEHNDRVLYLHTANTEQPDRFYKASYADFEDWRAQTKTFADMGACRDVARVSLSDEGMATDSYWAVELSPSAFRLVGRAPLLGRDFEPSDAVPGAAAVAILSHGLWEQRYARDPAIVGRSIAINGTPTAVIGVMPEGFTFPNKQDLWLPLVPTTASARRDARDDLMFVFGRLTDDASIDIARAEMAIIGQRLAAAHPATNSSYVPVVETFDTFFHGRSMPIYHAMVGAVWLVLLIACANLANLMLARAIDRSREIALHLALGAPRWRLVRQAMIECLLLAAAGAAGGWWIAKASLHAYVALAFAQYHPQTSPDLYPWFDFAMDHRAQAYLTVVATATALLFGVVPASRLRALDAHTELKDGGRGTLGGGRRRRMSATLVAAEVALAVVLLVGAGVLIRTVTNIYTADIGIATTNVVSTYVQLRCDGPMCSGLKTKYPTPDTRAAFFERLTARLAALPDVASVAIASRPPAFGATVLPFEIDGASPAQPWPAVNTLVIGDSYFRTLDAPVLAGRDFTDADDVSGMPAAIVNQQFAARHWPGEDPIGKRLRLHQGATPQWRTVVGLARDITQDFTRQATSPAVYVPATQQPSDAMWVIAKTLVPASLVVRALERAIHDVEPDIPLFEMRRLELALSADYRFNYAALFAVFALIALLLAALGLYAVVAHAMSRRAQEVALRMAIGATARDVVTLVLGQGLRPVAIGLAAGAAGALAVVPILKSVLIDVSPADPLTFLAAAATLAAAAMAGCLIPAWRAMRIDPVAVLRCE